MSDETPLISPTPQQSGLSDNAASGIAYLTFIPAIIFLATAPYNQKPLIRFHSWQSIFLCVAYIVIQIGLSILGHIPILGLIFGVVGFLVWVGFFILWLITIIKTFNGQMFKIPVIGDFAQKQADGLVA